MTAFTVQEGSEEQKCAFRRGETTTWINVSRHFGTHFEAQEAPLEALLGPSWGSKLGSQRLKNCVFRVGETLFFAFGGRLKEEAKPTKAEEPQEEATDAQKLAQRGSTTIIDPRNSGPRSPWRGVRGVKSY